MAYRKQNSFPLKLKNSIALDGNASLSLKNCWLFQNYEQVFAERSLFQKCFAYIAFPNTMRRKMLLLTWSGYFSSNRGVQII